MTIDEAIKLMEQLEKKASKSLQGKALITEQEIERLRLLLERLRT